jgi:hypothetical protein
MNRESEVCRALWPGGTEVFAECIRVAERGVALDALTQKLDMATDNCIRLATANAELGSGMMDAYIARDRLAKAIGIDIPSEGTMPLDDLADTVVAHIEAMHEERTELLRDQIGRAERDAATAERFKLAADADKVIDALRQDLVETRAERDRRS